MRQGVDFTVPLIPIDSQFPKLAHIMQRLHREIKPSLLINLQADGLTLNQHESYLQVGLANNQLIIDFYLDKFLEADEVQITLGESSLQTVVEGIRYEVKSYPASDRLNLNNGPGIPKETAELIRAVDTAKPSVFAVMLGLVLADPTGTVFKFSKFMQVVNKVYFVNLDYGRLLEAYLVRSATVVTHDSGDRPQQVFNARCYRGRVSRHQYTLDVFAVVWPKLLLYVVSFALQVVKEKLLWLRRLKKSGLVLCYWSNKLHLAVFGTVFTDFVWLVPRTLLHAHSLAIHKPLVCLLAAMLFCTDLSRVAGHLLDNRVWAKAFRHFDRLSRLQPRTTAQSSAKPEQQAQVIDHEKTNRELAFNDHLLKTAVASLRLDHAVFRSMAVRALSVFTWLRVPLLQLLIMGCQQTALLGLTIACALELGFALITLLTHLRLRHLRNSLALAMELSQPLFLGCFLLMLLLLAHNPRSDFLQRFGIWIIICSCCVEYLLLLAFIGRSIYFLIVKLLLMKKHSLEQPVYQYIKYTSKYLPSDESKDQIFKFESEFKGGNHHQTVALQEKINSNWILRSKDQRAVGLEQAQLEPIEPNSRLTNHLPSNSGSKGPLKASTINSTLNLNLRKPPRDSVEAQHRSDIESFAPVPSTHQRLAVGQVPTGRPNSHQDAPNSINTGNLQTLLQSGAILENSQSPTERYSLFKTPAELSARPRIFVMSPIYREKIKLNLAMNAIRNRQKPLK